MVTNALEHQLPHEMQLHTYRIMYEVEGSHWWFQGRRRIISSFLEPLAREYTGQNLRMLDVGCGTGANLELLSKYGQAEGVDVSEEALAFCASRGLRNVKKGRAEELPFDNQSFNIVTALDVVEHLDDDFLGLREMYRVLKPGGSAVLFVPAFMFLWGVQDDISHHRRRYTLPEIRSAVTEAGFRVERATYINISFFLPILAGRLLMRLTGFRPASENNLTISSLNGFLGSIFGAEALLLRHMNFPLGVSAICIARRSE